MKNQKVSTTLGITVIVIFTITVGVLVWQVVKNQQVATNNSNMYTRVITKGISDNALQDFQYSKDKGYYGTLTLTGYLDVRQRVCNPGEMCTKTVDYASFVIVNTDNKLIYDFINNYKGNSYVGVNSVGLGCYEKDSERIYSVNFGDNGKAENIISNNDLQKLLQSNKDNTVKIQLVKPITAATGTDAPECYSHFRLFKILP